MKLVEMDDEAAQPRGQRGLLRRREEAQRDLPDGGARAEARDPRRDRLGPRHRRAAASSPTASTRCAAPSAPMVVVTHYQRLLNYIVPDFVHVLADGRIVRSGGKELALELEEKGYAGFEATPARRRERAMTAMRRASTATVAELRAASTARGRAPPWLARAARARRCARFADARLPDHARRGLAVHQRRAARAQRVPAGADAGAPRRRGAGRRALACAAPAIELVFVNGRFAPALSSTRRAARRASWSAASPRRCARQPELVEPHLGALRAVRATHGVRPRSTRRSSATARSSTSPPASTLDAPIHLPVRRAAGERRHRRPTRASLIVAGAGSQATVVEQLRRRRRPYFTNAVTEIVVGDGAALDALQGAARGRARLPRRRRSPSEQAARQPLPLARRRARRRAGAQRRRHARSTARAPTCTLDGLYLAGGTQHVDNHTRIDHAQPHGTSRELYKGILDGARARRLQRQDRRAPGRAEDRRAADEPEPAALATTRRSTPSRSSRSSPTT